MSKRRNKQRHPNWNVNGMPERHQTPRLFKCLFRQITLNLQSIRGSGNTRVNITANKTTDNNDYGE